jgi:hypothetical protein
MLGKHVIAGIALLVCAAGACPCGCTCRAGMHELVCHVWPWRTIALCVCQSSGLSGGGMCRLSPETRCFCRLLVMMVHCNGCRLFTTVCWQALPLYLTYIGHWTCSVLDCVRVAKVCILHCCISQGGACTQGCMVCRVEWAALPAHSCTMQFCAARVATELGCDAIERIYAPEESNIIPQCSAGPGGTRPDLLVLQVGCPWQCKPSGM